MRKYYVILNTLFLTHEELNMCIVWKGLIQNFHGALDNKINNYLLHKCDNKIFASHDKNRNTKTVNSNWNIFVLCSSWKHWKRLITICFINAVSRICRKCWSKSKWNSAIYFLNVPEIFYHVKYCASNRYRG